MKFQQFFKAKVIEEISSRIVDKLPSDVKDLLAKKKLPFNEIFGDKLRLAEPLMGGKQYADKIAATTDDYEFDFDQWVGYKLTDKEKKNPVKIGKVISKRRQELEKFLKNPDITPEERSVWETRMAQADELLKTTNLQKQYQQSQTTSFYIVYSRAPIDVVRMGDFNWRVSSCHGPDGSYFHCALGDAMMNAGVIYLVDKDAFLAAGLDQGDALQADEIFIDDDRDVEGLDARARCRIRLVVDKQGNQLAVPTTKLYAQRGYEFNDDFIEQINKWAKKQDISKFQWNDTLTLKGGSYEDMGYSIFDTAKKLWGKTINFRKANDDMHYQDEDNDNDDNEEHFWDEVRDNLNRDEDRELFREYYATSTFEEEGNIVAEITHGGDITIKQRIGSDVVERMGGMAAFEAHKEKIEEALNANATGTVWRVHNTRGLRLTAHTAAPNKHDYGSYDDGEGHFDYEEYWEACRDIIHGMYTDVLGEEPPKGDEVELPLFIRAAFNNRLAEIMGVEKEVLPDPIDEVINQVATDLQWEGSIVDKFPIDAMEDIYVKSSGETIAWGAYMISSLNKDKISMVTDAAKRWAKESICGNLKIPFQKCPFIFQIRLTLPGHTKYQRVNLGMQLGGEIRVDISDLIHAPQLSIDAGFRKSGESHNERVGEFIDKGELGWIYELAAELNALEQDDGMWSRVFDKDDLSEMCNKAVRRAQHKDLLRQGQQEFDFSSLQRTGFDRVVAEMLRRL